MRRDPTTVYPYIPNSVPAVQEAMLREIGAENVDDLYEDVPPGLRFHGELDVPGPLLAEEARRDPEMVRTAPHRSTVHRNDPAPLDDPRRWAVTWRAHRRKAREGHL